MMAVARVFSIAALAATLVLPGCGPGGAGDAGTGADAPAPPEMSRSVAAAKPEQVGQCVATTISSVGVRLEGVPDSGSAIQYANGMSQVSYDAVEGIDHSRVGDEVQICLVSIPEDCPPGDDRGRVYAGTNQRTGETWSAPDSAHNCGGA